MSSLKSPRSAVAAEGAIGPSHRSRSDIYGLPVVGRFGLTHSMLAWARCEVWCREHGASMLAPNWNHLRIGPYLRGEADKREYHRLFRFPHYVTGVRRAWLLWRLSQVAVAAYRRQAGAASAAGLLVVFENRNAANFEHHFHEIVGHGAMLHAALRAMTRPHHLPVPSAGPHVAVHVRLGDFTAAVAETALRGGLTNARLPLNWYAGVLEQLRSSLGRQLPAIVYSDGTDAQMRPLLALPGVRRALAGSAVTDLLSIAQASALISSGSGFSVWGCFLGNVPRLCFPGQRLVRALQSPAGVELEPEVDIDQPIPADFLQYLTGRLA